MADDWENGGFGLYLHWPFCQAKCPYCDFNSHVARSIDQNAWAQAYLAQLQVYAGLTQGRVLHSVFFGGGTPSLMNPDVVQAIIAEIRRLWPVVNDLEITLEANPSSVEAGRFAAYADAGVNRISMGIQALNDADLHRLGRIHTAAEALRAFDIARNQFSRVSFDLIYARQNQTLAQWQAELAQALDLAIDHLSLYQLTIEDGTAFGDRYARGTLRGLPPDDMSADMYQATQDLCGAAGLLGYEVSNHARPGAESRHNKVYWRYGDYIGIGPGAHGRLTLDGQRYGTVHWSAPGKWLKAAQTTTTEHSRDAISRADQADEFLMMGLRLTEGISPARYAHLAGHPLPEKNLRYLCDIGMVETSHDNIRVTDAGRMVLNGVLKELITG